MARRQPRMSKLDLLTQNRQHAAQTRRSTADTVTTVTGVLRGYEQSPEWRADVEVYGGLVNLPAHAGAYVIDGGVRVQVENGRPTHVLGPTDTPVPDSLGPTTVAEGATPIVIKPDMSIDPAARARNEEVAGDLEQAQLDITQAQALLDAIGAADGPQGVAQAVSNFLDIEVDPDDIWTVVVAKFLVATEKIITEDVIATGAVTAPAMNVVHELPSGARLSIQPDGVRMWRAGNTGTTPNIAITSLDGFRMWDDNGNPTAWFDDTTGTLRLSGAVQSGGRVSGAELEVRNPAGDIVFSATPHSGVVIGGGGAVYQNAGPLVTDGDSVWITDPVPVTPGATYGWRFRAQSSPAFTSEQNYVEVIFTIGAGTAGEAITTHGTFPTIGSTQGVIESQLVAPAGASSMRLRYRRPDQPPPLPPDQYVQFTDIRITAVAAGTVDIGGSVKAPRGVFNRLEVDSLRGTSGIAWDPSDSGPLTFLLGGDWQQSQGAPRRRKRGDLVYLSGEVVALNPAAGEGRPITTLPPGWRPARRLRVPWGWGDSLTYVVVETSGVIWSGPNARTTSPGMSLDAIPPFSTTA